MRWRIVKTILFKELLDTFRDRRTLIMMVGVPLVLYPALLIISMQAMLIQQSSVQERVSTIAILGTGSETVKSWLESLEKVQFTAPEDPQTALDAQEVDAIVMVKGDPEAVLNGQGNLEIEVQFDAAEINSVKASTRMMDGLREKSTELRDARLAVVGLDPDFVSPLKLNRENVAPPAKTTGTVIGSILPMLLIVMIALGAFYPAVDVTAGEKERGTFETLLSTPTTKREIVTGKFFTVLALALMVGMLNLISMALTMLFMLNQLSGQLDETLPIEFQVAPSAIAAMFLVMVPLALFITAVMMCIAVFAKSFKEAQNYVTPFLIILIFPAMFGSFPGIKLSATTQFIPITNVVLLFRELLTGSVTFDQFFAVFLSTAAFALLSLQFAAWLFQREDVILAEDKGIPLSFNRKHFRPRKNMGASMALGYFLVMLVVIIYLASLLQQWHLLGGLFITQWVLLFAPALFLLWFVKIDLKEALSLRVPSMAALGGSALIALSALPLVIQFGHYQNRVLPVPKAFEEAFEDLLSASGSGSGLFILLLVVAFSPAICEEIVFRGAILSGLRERLNPWAAIFTVGILFGLFHLSIYRVVPTAILGIVLTYAVVRSGSIYTGMLMHFINNGIAVLLSNEYFTVWLGLDRVEESGVPPWILLLAVFLLVAGFGLVERGKRPALSPDISPA